MENTRKHNMEWSGSVTENEVQIPQNCTKVQYYSIRFVLLVILCRVFTLGLKAHYDIHINSSDCTA